MIKLKYSHEELVRLYMDIKKVDHETANLAVSFKGMQVLPFLTGVELARKMVEKGRFGRVSRELQDCLDYDKLADHLMHSGFHETPLGIVFIDERVFEKFKTEK